MDSAFSASTVTIIIVLLPRMGMSHVRDFLILKQTFSNARRQEAPTVGQSLSCVIGRPRGIRLCSRSRHGDWRLNESPIDLV